MIKYIANDPSADESEPRNVAALPKRPPNRAGFTFTTQVPQDLYDPETEPDGFVFWQCRQAAIATLEAWETVSDEPFTTWHAGTKIEVDPYYPDDDVNAYYERDLLSFAQVMIGTKTFRMAASTDMVAHEVGHGILDAARPELWDDARPEIAAFHESFGDCIAILTALQVRAARVAIVDSLHERNLVETFAESMAIGSKALDPHHNASAPRRARNTLKWQLPSSLPNDGGPGELINEAHSFAQIFTGCFYDTIVNVFDALPGTNPVNRLLKASKVVGNLLAKAIVTANAVPRFFRAVGRAMVKADEADNGGKYREAIKAAFERHNVVLGTGALLSPAIALTASAPESGAVTNVVGSLRTELLTRISAVGARLTVTARQLGDALVTEVSHAREVSLDHLDARLGGVVARARESVLLGASGGLVAILEGVPDPVTTEQDVDTFVGSLLEHGAIDFGAAETDEPGPKPTRPTHVVRKVGNKRVLTRVRFACRCCSRGA